MRVIVTGGRDYTDEEAVVIALTHIHKQTPITTLVSGNCRGADVLCEQWAMDYGVPIERHPANWREYGNAAGPRRNEEMASLGADKLIVFPGGTGTEHMVECAMSWDIPLLFVEEE